MYVCEVSQSLIMKCELPAPITFLPPLACMNLNVFTYMCMCVFCLHTCVFIHSCILFLFCVIPNYWPVQHWDFISSLFKHLPVQYNVTCCLCGLIFSTHMHLLYTFVTVSHQCISVYVTWICVCAVGCRARWLMPPQTWTTRKPSASSTTIIDQAAQDSGRRSVPAPSCLSAPASRPWQVRGHARAHTHPYRLTHYKHACISRCINTPTSRHGVDSYMFFFSKKMC